jgi:hypothetical protein
MKMLRSQAGVSTAGPDVHEVEGPPGDCGQHQGAPEDLASPFSKLAIDSDHFSLYISGNRQAPAFANLSADLSAEALA